MRPINRPNSSASYSNYRDARNDLAEKIGWYCSYCEMQTKNMIEIEHVEPVHNGGAELEWSNFLLSCKYCNTVKSNHNDNREGYIWPDEDNTFKVIKYSYGNIISVNPDITDEDIKRIVTDTILLVGLEREPGNKVSPPTLKDTRWISRSEAWGIAKESLSDYIEAEFNEYLGNQIVRTAKTQGHFSIWMEVFKEYPIIKNKLIEIFPGTDSTCFDTEGNPINGVKGKV